MSEEVERAAPRSEISRRAIIAIMCGLVLGMLLSALDQTVVGIAVRAIADDLNGYSSIAWCTTTYLVTSLLATPLYGKLSDLYGRRPMYLLALSVFVSGSLLCAGATSMVELAIFRAIQGIGAGGLMSLALAILGDILSPRERARYMGYFMAVFSSASVVGPLLGGVLSGQDSILGITGWRWIFLINVPLGVAALIVVARVLHLPNGVPPRPARVDWFGAAGLSLGVAPLLVVAEQGRSWGWGSGESATCFAIGIVGVLIFVAVEIRMGPAALIPIRLFGNGVFSFGIAISVVVGAAMFGLISLLPQYLQVVKGAGPASAGLELVPMMLGMMVGSIIAGKVIARRGRYKVFPIAGALLLALGLYLLHALTLDTQLWVVFSTMVAPGLGLGFLMQPLTLAIQNSVEPRDMGVATASATFFRQLGGAVGVAVFLAILFNVLPAHMEQRVAEAGKTAEFSDALAQDSRSTNPDVRRFAQSVTNPAPGSRADTAIPLDNTEVLNQVNPIIATPLKQGFGDSLSVSFLWAAFVAIAGFGLTVLWKEVPLRGAGGPSPARSENSRTETRHD